MQYTVLLQAAHVLPASERIAAEIRFAAALERALGEPHDVAETLRAWQCASESPADQVDRPTAARAVQWPRAFEQAVRAGLAGLTVSTDASFEVTLARDASVVEVNFSHRPALPRQLA
jgi:hypothetical protein